MNEKLPFAFALSRIWLNIIDIYPHFRSKTGLKLVEGGERCSTGGGRSSNLIGPQMRDRSLTQRSSKRDAALPDGVSSQFKPRCVIDSRLTLNLHLVTTTNFKVWSFPKISSLHKMSSYGKSTTKEPISIQNKLSRRYFHGSSVQIYRNKARST